MGTADFELLVRGAAEVISQAELEGKLARSRTSGKPLCVKLGADATAPDLHLGHGVVLRKLRQFQDLGHRVVFLIGDFTARIGDPTGKTETRPRLTAEQVAENARTYMTQVSKVLDPERTELRFNSEWLSHMSFADVVELCAKSTVARLLERDDFQNRFRAGRAIHVHEFFYPFMQGYDSVALQADVELGGTDQTFNILMARQLQKEYGQEPEVAMVMPILPGLDGHEKMSKSLGNAIGLAEPPEDMYGKLMSIPDEVLETYLTLLTTLPTAEIASLVASMAERRVNPRDVKMRLARLMVADYHGAESAAAAEQRFVETFQRHEVPSEVPEQSPSRQLWNEGLVRLDRLLCDLGLAPSLGAARRLIGQGAIDIGQERASDPYGLVQLRPGLLLRVGKHRFVRLSEPVS